MRFEILLSPGAEEDLKKQDARWKSAIREALETHLRHEPAKESKSRIKRLKEMKRPQYRLRVGKFRIYYDIVESNVEVIRIMSKKDAIEWLKTSGVKDENSGAGQVPK